MMYPYGFYLDPTYILVLIGAVISMIASAKVQSAFNKYDKARMKNGMTGAEAATEILHKSGIYDVNVERVGGRLSDHYDPSSKTLRLSDSTYGSASVAAVGVAAHECGHAIQHKEEYGPLKLRSSLVPAANIGSKMGIPIILLGVLLGYNDMLVQIGIWVFAIAVLFQLVTLPVEFNASNRAVVVLQQNNMMTTNELDGCKKVLGAAALTYVAAAASSILTLLRLVLLFGRNDRD